jgi:outer membrane protein OmpA-like peptidoglycan-associated protein
MAILETAVVALEAANEALESQNVKLAANNKNLNAEISSLKKQAKTEIDVAQYFAGITPTVYFEIGKSVLSPLELKHLEFIAEALIDKVDDDTQIVITVMGTADSNTGTPKRNKHLSEARGKYVYDILTQKYDINPEKIEIQSDILDATSDPMFDRAVVISF